jgi:hypothetical protein
MSGDLPLVPLRPRIEGLPFQRRPEQTYYRWKAKYGGMELSEMQRLKALGTRTVG